MAAIGISNVRGVAAIFAAVLAFAACRGQGEVAVEPGLAAASAPRISETVAPAVVEAPDAVGGTQSDSEVGPLDPRYLASFEQDAWYGVYFSGKKVGHVHRYARRDGEGVDAPWLIGFDLLMRFEAGSRVNELRGKETRYYAPTAPYRLVRSEYEQRGMLFDEARVAVVGPTGEMVITRTVGTDAPTERRVPATRETLADQLLTAPLDASLMPPPGGTKGMVWSWEQEKDDLATVESVGVESVVRAGIQTETMTLRVKLPSVGVPMEVKVATGGITLESTLGPSLVMKLEDRVIAETGITGLDVVGISIKSPRRLGSPVDLQQLEFQVSLAADVTLPDGPGQTVTAIEGEDRRALVVRDATGTIAADEASRAAALLADATMDSEHPDVVAKARELTSTMGSDAAKVDAIATWVYRTLDKKLATHLPAASVILKTKVGDCTEHTWLTVALLRAIGIPARPVFGVAYTGDSEAIFAYHAWVEVAVDGRWVAIDPTWGERVADATHLKFGHEPGQVAAFLDIITIDAVVAK